MRWLIAASVGGMLVAALLTAFTLSSFQKHEAPISAPPAAPAEAPGQIVAAPGLVESVSGIRKLSFEVPGKLRAVNAEEGQSVKAGQVLAELENADYAANVDSARAAATARRAELEALKADLHAALEKAQRDAERLAADCALIDNGPRAEEILRAKAQVRVAEAEAKLGAEDAQRYSQREMLASGAASQMQRDHALHQAEASSGKLDLARAQLQELLAGSRPEERQKAHAALAAAQAECARLKQSEAPRRAAAEAQAAAAAAQLDSAQVELEKTRLIAPVDGIVVWKFLHPGETVDALQHQAVLAVADVSHVQVRAYVDEADFPRVTPGATVWLSADAFPGRCFRGRVQRINASAGEKPFNTGDVRERMDVKVIETIVAPSEPWPFKLGLRVTARFECGRNSGAGIPPARE